jgi:uncharacterized protein YdhG (YjbR/CyaY superfamily)
MKAAASVDEYLAGIEPESFRKALLSLREVLRSELPDADEVINYGIPTFKVNGRNVIHYAGFKKHLTLFPGGIVSDFADRLAGYKTSKGGIQFTPEHPLPEDLVREITQVALARQLNRG